MLASETMRPDIVLIVSDSAACACVARGDALMSAIGLFTNSSPPTNQSSAFFITPVTPCAYSGLAIITPSAIFSLARRSMTEAGSLPSRSGLKNGRPPSPSYTAISIPSGAKAAAARSNAVFRDVSLRLPEIARICIGSVSLPFTDTRNKERDTCPHSYRYYTERLFSTRQQRAKHLANRAASLP